MDCPACGATATPAARFCATCGRALHAVDDERRVVTVLFADLVGFTSLSERLDPERVKNLVDRCFERLAVDVTEFGGQVDKIVGDAMIALFGAPTAHEDDAERAVRAALRMQDTLRGETDAIGQELRIRIGINTGEVLVGAMRAAGSVTAMGDVVNTASRLQTSAAPGEVLVGPATHAATERAIAYEPRGSLAARGREEPVETWRAIAPTAAPGLRARRDDVPLVGRDHELGLLCHATGTSITHHRALLVLLVGDVGMGKTRLADEVSAWARCEHDAVLREGRCLPYGEANVWWPVADALREGLGVGDGDDERQARAAVRVLVADALGRSESDAEVARTTEGLLTLLGHDRAGAADPAVAREDATRALGVYAGALAELRPLVLQISDLHWADDAVLRLVDDLLAAVHHRPIVVVATARPAVLDRWSPRPGRHNTLVLHLDPLGRADAAELLEVLVGRPVADDVADALLERSGGNPFFLEELVSLLDSTGAARHGELVATLPDTLRGLVAARLDDLDPVARAVLQNASVIGHRGPVAGLREMGHQLQRGVDVDAGLAQLVVDEIMEVSADAWSFRSDLVREVAYQTITKADRAKLHLGIAHYLEEAVVSRTPRPVWVVDQLAHHYGAAAALAAELGPGRTTDRFPADLADVARRWVVEAARRAARDQALPTAVRLYGQALDLGTSGTMAPDEAAQLHLARAELSADSWDLPGARADLDLAGPLVDQVADPALGARLLVIRGGVEQKEGDVDLAVATLTEAAERYRANDDAVGLGEALRQRGFVELFGGRLGDAESSAGDALAAFEEVGDRNGQAWALQNLAWIAFVTGRADLADERVQGAVEIFSDLVDGRGLAWSQGLLSWVRFQQRRVGEAEALGEQVLHEARSRNDPWATAMMNLLSASIRLWTGRTHEAVELADEARRSFSTIGDAYGLGQANAVLGRAMVMVGRVEEGFALLEDQAAAIPTGGMGAGQRWPGSDQVIRATRVATAVQVGEPERAADLVGEIETTAGFGGDVDVVLGLLGLQRGDLAGAAVHLAGRDEETTNPNLVSSQALYAAAAGTGRAAALADRVRGLAGATYADRALAEVAAGLEAARAGHGADAAARIAAARSLVAPTGDVVARAVVELAGAEVAQRTGDPDAPHQRVEADRRFASLGIDPAGWVRIMDLASGAVPA